MIDPTVAFLVSFIGAAFGSAATIIVNARIADKDRQEQRRKERTEFILHALQELVKLFAQYEAFIQQSEPGFATKESHRTTHAQIVGQAIAEILAVNDDTLSAIAINRLTPHMTEEADDPEGYKEHGGYKNRNRNAMIGAIKQLGYLAQLTIDQR